MSCKNVVPVFISTSFEQIEEPDPQKEAAPKVELTTAQKMEGELGIKARAIKELGEEDQFEGSDKEVGFHVLFYRLVHITRVIFHVFFYRLAHRTSVRFHVYVLFYRLAHRTRVGFHVYILFYKLAHRTRAGFYVLFYRLTHRTSVGFHVFMFHGLVHMTSLKEVIKR